MLSSLKKKFFREEGFFSTKMQRTGKHVANCQPFQKMVDNPARLGYNQRSTPRQSLGQRGRQRVAVGKTSTHVGAALAIFRKGVSVPLGQYAPQDRILLPGIWIDRCAEERRRKAEPGGSPLRNR